MSLIHELSYVASKITYQQLQRIEEFGLEIIRLTGTDYSGAIDVLVKGTFEQHQNMRQDSELARLFDLV